MSANTHPPVSERLPFDTAWLKSDSETSCVVTATGIAPCNMGEYAVQQVDEPGIPEPTWVQCEVVGRHFGECPPDATPYTGVGTISLPPGAVGIELHGANRTERLPIIFDAA